MAAHGVRIATVEAIFAGLAKGRASRQVVAAAAAAAIKTSEEGGDDGLHSREHGSDKVREGLARDILAMASMVHSSFNERPHPLAHSLGAASRRVVAEGGSMAR